MMQDDPPLDDVISQQDALMVAAFAEGWKACAAYHGKAVPGEEHEARALVTAFDNLIGSIPRRG